MFVFYTNKICLLVKKVFHVFQALAEYPEAKKILEEYGRERYNNTKRTTQLETDDSRSSSPRPSSHSKRMGSRSSSARSVFERVMKQEGFSQLLENVSKNKEISQIKAFVEEMRAEKKSVEELESTLRERTAELQAARAQLSSLEKIIVAMTESSRGSVSGGSSRQCVDVAARQDSFSGINLAPRWPDLLPTSPRAAAVRHSTSSFLGPSQQARGYATGAPSFFVGSAQREKANFKHEGVLCAPLFVGDRRHSFDLDSFHLRRCVTRSEESLARNGRSPKIHLPVGVKRLSEETPGVLSFRRQRNLSHINHYQVLPFRAKELKTQQVSLIKPRGADVKKLVSNDNSLPVLHSPVEREFSSLHPTIDYLNEASGGYESHLRIGKFLNGPSRKHKNTLIPRTINYNVANSQRNSCQSPSAAISNFVFLYRSISISLHASENREEILGTHGTQTNNIAHLNNHHDTSCQRTDNTINPLPSKATHDHLFADNIHEGMKNRKTDSRTKAIKARSSDRTNLHASLPRLRFPNERLNMLHLLNSSSGDTKWTSAEQRARVLQNGEMFKRLSASGTTADVGVGNLKTSPTEISSDVHGQQEKNCKPSSFASNNSGSAREVQATKDFFEAETLSTYQQGETSIPEILLLDSLSCSGSSGSDDEDDDESVNGKSDDDFDFPLRYCVP
ncbi:hypothetical protein PoB_005670800 [Plakobranchus ocellatus]|uniref:Uncharacterized protein n=1 Tax=Plakobranchus ocellatus TaxID=259542 RepID=A0AAV4CE48_9GAST|nr:hypothetical protein PoB_005670800 [Plakobranchus ocellatus]